MRDEIGSHTLRYDNVLQLHFLRVRTNFLLLKSSLTGRLQFPTRSHTVAAQGGINAALGNMTEDDYR